MRVRLSPRVTELQHQHNLSDTELAYRAGVTVSQLYHIKAGRRGAGARVIDGLLRLFPTESYESLFDSVESSPEPVRTDGEKVGAA